MRTISYDEYILNMKSDFYYVNLAYNIKHNKNYFTDILFKEEEHFEKFHNQHPLNTFIEYIEVLVNDNILSAGELIKLFKEKEISDNNSFSRLQEYITIYENRQMQNDFSFKFKMDIEALKEKLNFIKDNFSVCKSHYEYTPYQLTAPTYEELMEYYKSSELYERVKKEILHNSNIKIWRLNYDNLHPYRFQPINDILNICEILVHENISINSSINHLLSNIKIIEFDTFLLILDYLDEYLFIKNTTWHKYTIDIDVDMLINKVMLYYCSLYKNIISQERFNAIFEKYNITIDYSIPIEERQQLDLFYREKYRTLCEQEKQ